MDQQKYITLMDALKDMPDPRKARGRRFEWSFLLALICSALASGKRTGSEIADWVALHASELVERLRPRRGQVASGSTLRRVLRIIDLKALEQRVSRYTQGLPVESAPTGTITTPTGEVLQGMARPYAARRPMAGLCTWSVWASMAVVKPSPRRSSARKRMRFAPCPSCLQAGTCPAR